MSPCNVGHRQRKCHSGICTVYEFYDNECTACIACNGQGCGEWLDYCSDVSTCETRRHRKSCSNEFCTGSFVDDEANSNDSCNGELCQVTDCDYLDTACRDYTDVSAYCVSSGACIGTSCADYTNAVAGTTCGDCKSCDGNGNCNVYEPLGTPCGENKVCVEGVCEDVYTGGDCIEIGTPGWNRPLRCTEAAKQSYCHNCGGGGAVLSSTCSGDIVGSSCLTVASCESCSGYGSSYLYECVTSISCETDDCIMIGSGDWWRPLRCNDYGKSSYCSNCMGGSGVVVSATCSPDPVGSTCGSVSSCSSCGAYGGDWKCVTNIECAP